MKEKQENQSPRTERPEDRLDSLNARWKQRSNAPDGIRRSIEANLEDKTRVKRSEEPKPSATLKR